MTQCFSKGDNKLMHLWEMGLFPIVSGDSSCFYWPNYEGFEVFLFTKLRDLVEIMSKYNIQETLN